jgi:hypothetical protein
MHQYSAAHSAITACCFKRFSHNKTNKSFNNYLNWDLWDFWDRWDEDGVLIVTYSSCLNLDLEGFFGLMGFPSELGFLRFMGKVG